MLPAVVGYFYEVEAALGTGTDIASFGFEGEQVSVGEIMVRKPNLISCRNISTRLMKSTIRIKYLMLFTRFSTTRKARDTVFRESSAFRR
jgi:hypothetical protein